jgi:hypothetical protein
LTIQEPHPELESVHYPVLVARPADNAAIDRISKNIGIPLLVMHQNVVAIQPVTVFRIMTVLAVAAMFSNEDCQDFAIFH